LLRHAVATLAYRAEKVLRDAPETFASARVSASSRSALEIVSHLGDLAEWGQRLAEGDYVWAPNPAREWTAACDRFFASLTALDEALAKSNFEKHAPGVIFQGPIADALTHVGQIAMLRRMAGAPVRGENYFVAAIETGRVGTEQAPPRREFD